MKKLLYLFSATLLALASCTNDYDGSCVKKNDVNPIKNDTISPPKTDSIPIVIMEPFLLKKLVHTYTNGEVSTLELSYKDNKILSDRDGSNTTLYTYTGDVITKIEKADLSGDVYLTKEYVYANGKVDYILSNEFGNYYKTKYHYNSDGSVFYYKLNSDSLGTDGQDTGISGRYTFSEGNLITDQFYNGSYESLITFEYDSKNNPRLNILGFNLLIDTNEMSSSNNIIKRIGDVEDSGTIMTTIFSHEYNENGYPVKTTQTLQIGHVITKETSTYSY
ncbi:hypothetical protein [Flavobacterium pectinovorum]|uniref:DUF4595 domain-containing protein n=1 Tax=Flavobacterium pectinovorum TaxID=29533 RepID=A0A502EIN2_9FLAO|nr:hypothetical protein [Flavobacterium pectinovorum]TPG36356.1 hypothetical protein EAH81_19990 [Flavobacterium pectinovorum]